MIDERLLQQLASQDADTRKRAIKALAQTKDRDALPHLARVYKQDPDNEIRDLARKAGVYIKKNAPESMPQPDLYDDADDDLLPSQMDVSSANAERARGYLNQAMDWHTRGDNGRAREQLQRALAADPRLIYDDYTVSFAATITGLPGEQAVRQLAPSRSKIKTKQAAPSRSSSSGVQGLLALLMMVSAVVALVGYLLMPWMDYSIIPIEPDGVVVTEPMTLAGLPGALRGFFGDENLRSGLEQLYGQETVVELDAAINGLNFTLTGLDVTLIALDATTVQEISGIQRFLEVSASLGVDDAPPPQGVGEVDPADTLLALILVGAPLAIIVGIVAILRANVLTWIIGLLSGLLGMATVVYYSAEAAAQVIPPDFEFGGSGAATVVPNGMELLAFGYWASAVAMVLVTLLPVFGLLLMPAKD